MIESDRLVEISDGLLVILFSVIRASSDGIGGREIGRDTDRFIALKDRFVELLVAQLQRGVR